MSVVEEQAKDAPRGKRGTLLRMVQHDGYTLKYVPERYRDREMCLVAVRDGGAPLAPVPRRR